MNHVNQDLWLWGLIGVLRVCEWQQPALCFPLWDCSRGSVLVVVVDENLHIWVNRSQGGAQIQRDKFSFFLGGAWTVGSLWFPPFCNELLVNASRVST